MDAYSWNGAPDDDEPPYDEPQTHPRRIGCQRPDCRRLAVWYPEWKLGDPFLCRECADVMRQRREVA